MTEPAAAPLASAAPPPATVWTIFLVFLRLGLTSFGGPVAHLGYFRDEFVHRRRWLTEQHYADLVALCQFLPGPASSQVGMALGQMQRGYAGAVAAWAGFTLPSAALLIAFALGLASSNTALPAGVLHGLKIAAVAVVAQAVCGMGRHLCPDRPRVTMMAVTACVTLLAPSALIQAATLVVAGLAGAYLFKTDTAPGRDALPSAVSRRAGAGWLMLLVGLLAALPVAAALWPSHLLSMVDAFFRAGALVFGGGHVVLPLLQAAVVPTGWVSNDTFMAGYGAAQAVPGPLFTFAAFLGASMHTTPTGWLGGLIGLLAIFAPSFLLVAGALPFWERLRVNRHVQAALMGVNAAVVGLLAAALYHPVWTSAIHGPRSFALALSAWVALMFWRSPPWLVVLVCGLTGWAIALA